MATRPPHVRTEQCVDLNADLGEEVAGDGSADADSALLSVVTSANVACGYHAGSPATMRAVCEEAAARGVAIGAHVSYDDRSHFGRVDRDVEPALLRDQVADQVAALGEAARSAGAEVTYLKPHGALYHRVRHDDAQARAVLAGCTLAGLADLPVLGMPGVLLDLAREGGREAAVEGFPDRAYDAGGRLVPRSQPGALVHDPEEVAARALALAPHVASVCLHGDTPGALARAAAVRAWLVAAGWRLEPFAGAR